MAKHMVTCMSCGRQFDSNRGGRYYPAYSRYQCLQCFKAQKKVKGAGPREAGFISPKSRWVALFLCLFLGFFGAHQFYVGNKKMGVLYLFTVGLFMIGWIVDIFRIHLGKFRDGSGRYL